ncbi:MAG: hypothetical protein IT168_31030 [Bryobacterales bacterium]|nr:hypothetical protein [Bryobacterales bacterium]
MMLVLGRSGLGGETAAAVARMDQAVHQAYLRGELPWYCTLAFPFVTSCQPIERLPQSPIQRTGAAAPQTANQMSSPSAWTPDELSAYTAHDVAIRQDELERNVANTAPSIINSDEPFSMSPLGLGILAAGALALLAAMGIATRR